MSESGHGETRREQILSAALSITDDLLRRSEPPGSAMSRPSGRGQDGTIRACTASGEYASFQSEPTGYSTYAAGKILLHETARVHHASRRCGSRMAAGGACTAADAPVVVSLTEAGRQGLISSPNPSPGHTTASSYSHRSMRGRRKSRRRGTHHGNGRRRGSRAQRDHHDGHHQHG